MTGDSGWLRGARKWWGMENRKQACTWRGAQWIYGAAYSQTQYMDNSIIWLPWLQTLLLTTVCLCMTLRSDAREQNASLVRQERQKATSLKKKYDVISCFLHNGASCGGSANWQDTEKGNITDRNPGRVHDGPLAHVDKGTSVHHAQ